MRTRQSTSIRTWLLLVLALAGATVARAVLPPAYTIISTRAHITFVDAASKLNSATDSNAVRALILPVQGVALTRDASIAVPPGGRALLYHTLTNTGNIATTYTLTTAFTGGDPYTLSGLTLYIDVNTNGFLDKDDLVVPSDGTVTLEAGTSVQLGVSGQVPVTAGIQDACHLTLTAKAGTATATVHDTITAIASVAAQVFNAVSALTTTPDSPITYTVTANNIGTIDAQPITLTIDGVADALVVLRFPIPVNTHFAAAASPNKGRVLYHVWGEASNAFHAAPVNGKTIDAVAFGIVLFPSEAAIRLTVDVTVDHNATGKIPSAADLHFIDTVLGGPQQADSNTVVTLLPGGKPALHYYSDATYGKVADQTSLGKPLYVKVTAAERNVDPGAVDRIQITITSTLTGDAETFIAVETGPNTGEFIITPAPPTQDANQHAASDGDGTMQTLEDDILVATIEGYDGLAISTTILIDPYGTVYDSITNAPVAGARVRLIDVTGAGNGGKPGELAVVFNDDLTPAPNDLITGVDGRYRFPLVAPSTYRLDVTPPADYFFPSLLPPALQPPGRVIDVSASYHGTFDILITSAPVRVDLPLDFDPKHGLYMEKTASRRTAEIGDDITYTVTVRNVSKTIVKDAGFVDTLPLGFRYIPGSARRDGAATADPAGGRGPALTFTIGDLPVDAVHVFTYRVHIGPGAAIGDAVNRVQGNGTLINGPAPSNQARAVVTVKRGIFNERGILFGKIFLDTNHNGVQEIEEIGVPGVRVYLDDGTYAITDSEGKYSIYGLSPRLHVAKVDLTTLPAGAVLEAKSSRHGGDGNSRFVDMTRSEMQKANFTVVGGALVEAAVNRRRTMGEVVAEMDSGLRRDLLVARPAFDPRSLPAAGTVDNVPAPAAPASASLPPVAPVAKTTLLSTMDNAALQRFLLALKPGFAVINLTDGQTLADTHTAVQLKGVNGARFALTVNGTEVPAASVGMKASIDDTVPQVWEYIGIVLRPGANTLEAVQWDAYGNERGRVRLTVRAPGRLARVRLTAPAGALPADGAPVALRVSVLDAQNNPVGARTPVTLDADGGSWQTPDADPATPGLQLFVEGGSTDVQLLSPTTPGTVTVTAVSGLLKQTTRLAFGPGLRPLIVVGGGEVTLYARRLKTSGFAPVGRSDGFDDQLPLPTTAGGYAQANAYGSVFMKGAIFGNRQLTLRYDSARDGDDALFRDLEPEEFYPLYGDSSIKGFDAQSTGPLYLLLEQNRSSLLFGDYTTAQANQSLTLGGYARSFSGLRHHLASGPFDLTSFASYNTQRQRVDELPANGTSGPFQLRALPLVWNSERVEVIVRDRNQPSIVLKSTLQQRFVDYDLDADHGRLIFRAPIPSLTPELNPISIRVAYEVEQGGTRYWVGGTGGQVRLASFLSVGGTLVEDANPQDLANLRSANVTLNLGPDTTLVSELARSWKQSLGSGWGRRVEFTHRGARWSLNAYTGNTDLGFDNPTSSLGRGRAETGVKGGLAFTPQLQMQADFLHSKDVATGGTRDGGQVGLVQTFSNHASVEVGVRHAEESSTAVDNVAVGGTKFTSLRLKLAAPLYRLPRASVYGEYERDISNAEQQVAAVGGDYQLGAGSRLYARHEFVSALGGRYALNTSQSLYSTLVGLDSGYMPGGRVFSEYRARDAFAGREAEAAIGLRNQFRLGGGYGLTTSFERLHALNTAARSNESTAATAALDYTGSALWKGTTRIEARRATQADTLMHTLGAAVKVNRDWSFLGKNLISLSDANAAGTKDTLEERVQVGLAYRPVDRDAFNGLLRYEYVLKKNVDADVTGQNDHVQLVRLDGSYQPVRAWVFSGHYAGKLMRAGGDAELSYTHMLAGRLGYDFSEHWNGGLMASTMTDTRGKNTHYGLGGEIGYLVWGNWYLSAGYNVFGFTDEYLTTENYTDQGAYLRLRFKFDEDLFRGKDPQVNTTLPPR
jgi:uncharacterized repeat protein (TIGR01451 family)